MSKHGPGGLNSKVYAVECGWSIRFELGRFQQMSLVRERSPREQWPWMPGHGMGLQPTGTEFLSKRLTRSISILKR